ncbi:MAG: methyltransferase domain-containing protein, partial [Rhodospirillales bacterium]|nr:methyltransferase domain-containing protein [Rhodospirillales bacterium]
PMVLARLVQAADIGPGDLVLDIGCATGYSSAVLARLANTVVALESDTELAAAATRTLGELGIDTVAVVEGRLERGYPEQGPYDAILLNGAIPDVPDAIRGQLSDGGRLVAVVANGGVGRGVRVLRHGDHFARVELFDAATPALEGFAAPPAFVF